MTDHDFFWKALFPISFWAHMHPLQTDWGLAPSRAADRDKGNTIVLQLGFGPYVVYRCEAHHTLKAFSLQTGKQAHLHIPKDKKMKNCKIFHLRVYRKGEWMKDEWFDYFAIFQFFVWSMGRYVRLPVSREKAFLKCGELHTGTKCMARGPKGDGGKRKANSHNNNASLSSCEEQWDERAFLAKRSGWPPIQSSSCFDQSKHFS